MLPAPSRPAEAQETPAYAPRNVLTIYDPSTMVLSRPQILNNVKNNSNPHFIRKKVVLFQNNMIILKDNAEPRRMASSTLVKQTLNYKNTINN